MCELLQQLCHLVHHLALELGAAHQEPLVHLSHAPAAQSVTSKPTAKSSSSKLPLHLQKARKKAKRSGASELVDTESASEDAKESEDVSYVQKVRLEHFQTEIRFDISFLLQKEVYEPFYF